MKYSATEFEALYIQCFPPSMRLAMSLLHEEDEARDVVQEVFLKLWESGMRFDNPLAFIIRAVRNACLNRISMMETREKVRRRLSLDSPPDDFDIEAHHEEVMTAVRSLLTPREREIVDKIYADGLSYRETAENLEVSVAAVNQKYSLGTEKTEKPFQNR